MFRYTSKWYPSSRDIKLRAVNRDGSAVMRGLIGAADPLGVLGNWDWSSIEQLSPCRTTEEEDCEEKALLTGGDDQL